MFKSLEMAFRGSSFQNFPGEGTPWTSLIGRTFRARMFSPPTFNSFPSLCVTNIIVQIIVLNGPLKPANTNSVSQNFENLGKDIPELPHFRVCPPHFLERIVALDSNGSDRKFDMIFYSCTLRTFTKWLSASLIFGSYFLYLNLLTYLHVFT